MAPRTEGGPEGLLLVDKPPGPTSHDVVARVRRLTGQRRIGHAGTLDPMASGLLPLMLGRMTRLVRFLPGSPKVYRGEIELGWTSVTDDATGEPVARHGGPSPDPAAVLREAGRLTGTILQVPPAVSARKVGGQRLYKLARQGREVQARAAKVECFRFDLEPTADPWRWSFVAEVSAGTYIRALARDLGAALGTGGVLASLRRTAVGPLRVEDAVPLAALEQRPAAAGEALVAPAHMPLEPPVVAIAEGADRRRFVAGNAVEPGGLPPEPGPCRVLGPEGELLGIGIASGATLRPSVVVDSGPVAPPSGRVLSSPVEYTEERKKTKRNSLSGPPADDGGAGGG